MPEHAYTVRDTPEVVDRIQGDLDRVVEAVRTTDPHLRALVLTGGFARGEGAVANGRPQNDYDFIAVRSGRRRAAGYPALQAELEKELGLHIDLAPVPAWRLRWVPRSIFWYETALRGRTLWGPNMLDRIPIRHAAEIEPTEGLRLLVNRAAGLLLYSQAEDRQRRLQAAKALLAASDVHLLAAGFFPPTQTERWRALSRLYTNGQTSGDVHALIPWIAWAYHFKVDPDTAPAREPHEAWTAAARAVLESVPVALRHAGLRSLEEYERRDTWIDRVVYYRRAATIDGARRWVTHPTGRVRVATLRLLEASLDGRVRPEEAERWLGPLAPVRRDPLAMLDRLRRATLQ